ncbi:MAG: DEAD/DEAH box helicase family protein [Methylobacter sp.]
MLKQKQGLANLRLQTDYRTGSSDPIMDLYVPCLHQSILYKRAVGYFRSSVYLVAGTAVIDFARRGGKIQLVCSPELDTNDTETIRVSYLKREEIASAHLIDEIERLLANPETKYPTRVLATLVSVGALEIKIAIRKPSQGLYHEKIGVFIDEAHNRVSFIGSANESWSGWHPQGNFESIEVFCSWRHSIEEERSARHEANFDNLWVGNTPAVQTLPFPEAVRHCLCKEAFGSLDEAEKDWIPTPVPTPHTNKRDPLPHQINAIESWRKQGSRGIFEHATGSGKTFTALEAARSHLNKDLPVLILVPSRILLEQWNEEVKTELPDAVIVLAGAGHNRWKRPGRIKGLSTPHATGSWVIIATMQTAATDAFRQCLYQGSHLMLIADEVHQIGSSYNSQCLQIDAGHRLGLSATPKRYGDPDGTARIFDYFGPVVPPPITLSDAVKSGRLVEYEYHSHSIRLTADEADAWKAFTRQIGIEILKLKNAEGETRLSDRIKMLLIQRSRIAKKASGKPRLAAQIIKKYYEAGQGWLIYCEDGEQLRETMQQLKLEGIEPIEYHTGMDGDRDATLDWFRKFGGVLVSIKCLDEGVDIPAVSHALILASSQNPRQFIQRRGRVLRTAPGKHLAIIHDAIVVPVSIDDEPEQLSLLKSELLRAIEFSNSALNKSAGAELRQIAREMGFDPEETGDIGIEEEEE